MYANYCLSIVVFTYLSGLCLANSISNELPKREHEREDHYYEDLFIRPLSDGKLFAQFQFKTLYRKDIRSLRWETKFEIFPLSLADLVGTADLNRLHFSLTKGNWNYRNWGFSTRPSPPGAEIKVQLSQYEKERSWKRLVNSLAGKFCASLVDADMKNLVRPNLASNTLYAHLPEETFCTENLTPWKKLLPCYSNSGLASLLNAVSLFKSSFSSMAIDLEPAPCRSSDGQIVGGCEQVQSTQTISIVFDLLNMFEGKQMWSLAKVFGASIERKCPLAEHSRIHVDITNPDDRKNLYPQTFEENSLDMKFESNTVERRKYATFDVNSLLSPANSSLTTKGLKPINVGVKQSQIFKQAAASSRSIPPVHLNTHVAGVGSYEGAFVSTITNNHDEPIQVAYTNIVPHFLRFYLHTLSIKTKSGEDLRPDRSNFALGEDRRPSLIQLSLTIPPNDEVRISYRFERAFLRWSEYKPDANKGVLLASTSIEVSFRSGLKYLVFPTNSVGSQASSLDPDSTLEGETLRIYSRPALIIQPTPDFSMLFNALWLVCNVLMVGFMQIYNMTSSEFKIIVTKTTLEKMKRNEDEMESKKIK